MKVSQFLLFLAALTGANSNQVFRKHVFVNTPMSWSEAQEHCRQNYVGLSIIDTFEEYNSFTSQTANIRLRGWIGLNKSASEGRYTKWSDGTVLSFSHWVFEPINNHNENCITTQNGGWTDYVCDGTMYFFCYSEVILVEEKKTWDEALDHCSTQYTDLFSLTTGTDFYVVYNKNISMGSFWTGLHFLNGLWICVNKKLAVSPSLLPPCPNQPFTCGALEVGALSCENRDCMEQMYFACLHQGNA